MTTFADLDIDFVQDDTETPKVVATVVTPTVTQSVRPAEISTSFRATPESEWGWGELRDYILTEIEQRHGPQVRDPRKESGIVKGFISRWGIERSIAISQSAFGTFDGMWRNAPISINRFCRGSDPYFAEVIAKRL